LSNKSKLKELNFRFWHHQSPIHWVPNFLALNPGWERKTKQNGREGGEGEREEGATGSCNSSARTPPPFPYGKVKVQSSNSLIKIRRKCCGMKFQNKMNSLVIVTPGECSSKCETKWTWLSLCLSLSLPWQADRAPTKMKEVTNPSSSSGNLTQTPGFISSSHSAWVNQQHLHVCVCVWWGEKKKPPQKISCF
jgi:hypothetical protein